MVAKYERERVLVELLTRRRGLSVAGNSQAFTARSNPPSRLRKTHILVKLWTIRVVCAFVLEVAR